MNRYLVILFAMVLIGCGGGGSSAVPEVVTPPANDITGVYNLQGFEAYYNDGSMETEADYEPWSGKMMIGPSYLRQEFVYSGQPFTNGDVPYYAVWSGATTVTFCADDGSYETMPCEIYGMTMICLSDMGIGELYHLWIKVGN